MVSPVAAIPRTYDRLMTSVPGHSDNPLAVVDGWDVPNVAAAAFDSTGVRWRHGDAERTFALASVSKIFTAVTTMIAVEEGTVGLDDPVGPPGSTLRHLLSHASGLAPDEHTPPLAEPGTRRIYSNLGFATLAAHVADRADMAFGEYAHAALVDPLALSATDLSGAPARGFTASVSDVCRMLLAVVNHEVLAPSTVSAMVTPAFGSLSGVLPGYGSQDPNPWGLGVEIRGTKSPHWTADANSPATWGHFGQTGTFAWFDPDAGIGLVVLTDRDFGPWAVDAWPQLSAMVLSAAVSM